MKVKILVILAGIVLQVFIALSPMVPITASWWHAEDPVAFYSRLAVMVGLQFTFLSSALILLGYQNESDSAKLAAVVRAAFPPVMLELLKGSSFYSQFRSACELAQHTVRISYFAPYPPPDVKDRDRNRYYSDILDLMKHRKEITFKRIIRQSAKNDSWTAELLRELDGKGNNDVALLADVPSDEEMPLAMSVQVVDESDAWLVAVSTHETEGSYRDLHIHSNEASKVLTQYYERIWAKSVKLLDRGRITESGAELIRAAAGKK